MRRIIVFVVTVCMMLSLAACGNPRQNKPVGETETPPQVTQQSAEAVTVDPAQSETEHIEADSDRKVLVVYFAYSENIGDTSGMDVDAVTSASLNKRTSNSDGNLQVMAREAAAVKNGDLFSIQITDPYDPDYNAMVGVAQKDQRDGKEFYFVSEIENFSDYDTVYIGIPVWWGALPQPMVSFFEHYDFSGKTVVPFGIHLGSRFGSMIGQMKELEPNALFLDGFTIRADTDNDKVRAEFDAFLEKIN